MSIDIEGTQRETKVRILNNLGKDMIQPISTFTKTTREIDLSIIPTGFYFIQLQMDNYILTKQIIKTE